MRNSLLILCFLLTEIVGGKAQMMPERPVVMERSWEEASRKALKEKKLVFVTVGMDVTDKKVKRILEDEAVRLFLERNAVAMGIDRKTPEGKAFEPKLLLYEGVFYAFYMPFGDLLKVVDLQAVEREPAALIDAGREALERADEKRKNSRSVIFEKGERTEVLEKAREPEKPVFVMRTMKKCQECLLMEKNVLNLDRVADFYNENFVNLKEEIENDGGDLPAVDGPFWVFLNAEGKRVYEGKGKLTAEELIRLGEEALRKAEGVEFETGSWEDVVEKARREGKKIFADFYMPVGKERRERKNVMFRDPDVADFFNRHFVNIRVNLLEGEGKELREKYGVETEHMFYFLAPDAQVLHRKKSIASAEELLDMVGEVLNGGGLIAMQEKYAGGEREAGFVRRYIRALADGGLQKEAGEAAERYLTEAGKEKLREQKYWEIYSAYVWNGRSDLFDYVRAHRKELGLLWGETAVNRKIQDLWEAGAESFAEGEEGHYTFDEGMFREYIKKMKKEKVTGWRSIARKARMNVAEKMGDWRTYTELAEERWNEENVSEAELYDWGVKINRSCQDKSIRFKAARWFAVTAIQLEEKERLTGKVNLSSYKGFFEKLVDELAR